MILSPGDCGGGRGLVRRGGDAECAGGDLLGAGDLAQRPPARRVQADQGDAKMVRR